MTLFGSLKSTQILKPPVFLGTNMIRLAHGVGPSTFSMMSVFLADMECDSSMSLHYLCDRLVDVQLDLCP